MATQKGCLPRREGSAVSNSDRRTRTRRKKKFGGEGKNINKQKDRQKTRVTERKRSPTRTDTTFTHAHPTVRATHIPDHMFIIFVWHVLWQKEEKEKRFFCC